MASFLSSCWKERHRKREASLLYGIDDQLAEIAWTSLATTRPLNIIVAQSWVGSNGSWEVVLHDASYPAGFVIPYGWRASLHLNICFISTAHIKHPPDYSILIRLPETRITLNFTSMPWLAGLQELSLRPPPQQAFYSNFDRLWYVVQWSQWEEGIPIVCRRLSIERTIIWT